MVDNFPRLSRFYFPPWQNLPPQEGLRGGIKTNRSILLLEVFWAGPLLHGTYRSVRDPDPNPSYLKGQSSMHGIFVYIQYIINICNMSLLSCLLIWLFFIIFVQINDMIGIQIRFSQGLDPDPVWNLPDSKHCLPY